MPTEIMLRLTIADPVAGVLYSLQDAKSVPVEPRTAGEAAPLSFLRARQSVRRRAVHRPLRAARGAGAAIWSTSPWAVGRATTTRP